MLKGAGAIIGRFQVADLTRGHDELLHRVAFNHNKVVVLLGVHPRLSNKTNPLSFESREHMLRVHWDETIGKNSSKKLVIAPLPNRATDETWSVQVDHLLDSLLGPRVEKTLYGGRDSFITHYSGKFPIGDPRKPKEITSGEEFLVDGSATEQREQIFESPPMTEDGRAGAIWAMGHQWNRIDPCVDMAVVRYTGADHTSVQALMGRKYAGSGLFCFPGGHIGYEDSCAEECASRELKEEASVEIPVAHWKYLCQIPINDWRNLPNQKTWSTLFVAEISHQIEPVAGDDLDAVEWVDLSTDIAKVATAHHEMFKRVRAKYNITDTDDVIRVINVGDEDE